MWSYNYTYTNEMTHYGVKGMKWGVRRYRNKNGTLTPTGKRQNEENLKQEKMKKKRALIGAAIAVGTIAIIGGVAYSQLSKDGRLIKAGEDYVLEADKILTRVAATSSDPLTRDFTYVTASKSDVNKYIKEMGSRHLNKKIFATEDVNVEDAGAFVTKIKAKEKLRFAGKKEIAKTLKQLKIDEDPDEYLKVFGQHVQPGVDRRLEVIDHLSKKGYAGMVDLFDSKYTSISSMTKANNPLIAFGKNKALEYVSSEPLTIKQLLKRSKRRNFIWGLTKNVKKVAIPATAAGLISLSVLTTNKKIKAYRLAHPNSKKTDNEILKEITRPKR